MSVPHPSARPVTAPTVGGHLAILRVDHWVKNVFVLPGIVLAWFMEPESFGTMPVLPMAVGLLATCLVSSNNYVLNELLDAEYDRMHPTKRHRPVPAGEVHESLAYVQWIAVGVLGIALGAVVSTRFTWVLVALWSMGWIYNMPPLRTKEVPHLDVISEAANNPVRLLAGWFLTSAVAWPPVSLLLSYWMLGAFFMALKRFAERRAFADLAQIAMYRTSFRYYTEGRLLAATTFYGSTAMLLFGAFCVAYRPQLLAAFPLIAWVMAAYVSLGFDPRDPLQHPETLYRERSLLLPITLCAWVLLVLLFVEVPLLAGLFPAGPPA